MSKQTVAVLGLGIMGSGMAGRILAAGFDVAVWNRSADKAAALGAAGARVAQSPADAVRDADIVVAMLSDDDVSRAVWTGDAGALAAMKPGAVAIECSTLTVDWVRALGAAAAARGVGFLDAPVTGSRLQASEGKLRFFVGGEAGAIEQARPAFDAMGTEVLHLGPAGSGAILKLVNNFMCGVQVASLAEAIAMIERSGLDTERAVGLLSAGAPGSPIVAMVAKRMLEHAYEPNFFTALMAKDLDYAGKTLAAAGTPSELAAAARRRFLDAEAAGFGDRDIASVVEPLRGA